eukprot:scaffold560747_cov23-Prasinocladus_malaysianus.AAC.1
MPARPGVTTQTAETTQREYPQSIGTITIFISRAEKSHLWWCRIRAQWHAAPQQGPRGFLW